MSDVDLFHGKGQLAPVQLLPRILQGDSPTKCRKEALELQKKARQKIEEKVKQIVR